MNNVQGFTIRPYVLPELMCICTNSWYFFCLCRVRNPGVLCVCVCVCVSVSVFICVWVGCAVYFARGPLYLRTELATRHYQRGR
jgi:hypothetical protein